MAKEQTQEALTQEELELQKGENLPKREVMSLCPVDPTGSEFVWIEGQPDVEGGAPTNDETATKPPPDGPLQGGEEL